MAAFSSFHHNSFILDSNFLSTNTPNYLKMSSFVEEENINNTNSFSQFYPPQLVQEIPVQESSCLDHTSKVAFSDNEPCVTKKQNTESSMVVDKLESGEQVTQKVTTPMEKKRKIRNRASLTSSTQSKVDHSNIKFKLI
jgi:hypothetical protein